MEASNGATMSSSQCTRTNPHHSQALDDAARFKSVVKLAPTSNRSGTFAGVLAALRESAIG
jgi:hypothetical protein